MCKFFAFFTILFLSGWVKSQCPYTPSINFVNPVCGEDGTIRVTLVGATTKTTYVLYRNNEYLTQVTEFSMNISALTGGNYKVIYSNGNNCYDSVFVTLSSNPNAFTTSFTCDSARCDTSKNGALKIIPTNGIRPLNFQWSHDINNKDSFANNLAVGEYKVTVTDASGCVSKKTMNVSYFQKKIKVLDTIIVNADCDIMNGSINVHWNGGYPYSGVTPYIFKWINNDSIHMPLDSLGAGKYTCIITDSLACYPTVVKDIEIKQFSKPKGILVGQDSICFDKVTGSLKVQIVSGDSNNIKYSWKHDPSNKKSNAFNLYAGDYQVVITDNAKCTDTIRKTLYDYPPKNIDLIGSHIVTKGGTLRILIKDTTGFKNFVWEPKSLISLINNGIAITPKEPVDVSVEAKYGPGCTTKTIFPITVSDIVEQLIIPDQFSPNGDGVNDVYFLRGSTNDITTLEFKVYDKWGNNVYNAFDYNFKWDGNNLSGSPVKEGIYVYLLKYTTISSPFDRTVKNGTIMIIK
jgi:gliding motility-associated-like protein